MFCVSEEFESEARRLAHEFNDTLTDKTSEDFIALEKELCHAVSVDVLDIMYIYLPFQRFLQELLHLYLR